MEWISSVMKKRAALLWLCLITAGLAVTATQARADFGAGNNLYRCIQNDRLILYVGAGSAVGGAFSIETTASNPTDPNGILLFGGIFATGNAVEAQNGSPIQLGTRVFLRVNGGRNGGGGGYDYVFGRHNNGGASDGVWLIPPRQINSRIEGSWQTLPITVNGRVIDPRIQVDLIASIVHDTVRFQFIIKNNSPGSVHTVGLAMTQDVDTTFIFGGGVPNFTFGGPLRLPNAPYIRQETLLAGGQIPPFWEVFVNGPPQSGTTVPRIRSVRGILAPQNSGQTEPTRPSRFAFGSLDKLNGFNATPPAGVVGRDYDVVWNFQPDPRVNLQGAQGTDAAVTVFWDERAVSPGQEVSIVTYIGQSTGDTDYTPPVSLFVTAPQSLGFTITRDTNGNPIGCATNPANFDVTASVQNLTDLTPGSGAGVTISPVTVFLDLPRGLRLVAGQTNPKTLLNVAPGAEASTTWRVEPDPNNPVSGTLRYTVTMSPNIGNGKSVQRTIEVTAPPIYKLRSNPTTQGNYQMVSFPFITGNTPPSAILGLNGNAPDFDLVRWNPLTGHYEPVNSFVPGQAYWIRSRLTSDANVIIDCTKYPPLDNQVVPNNVPFQISYPRGWNQVANPNIYGVRFSEIQVFDQTSLQLVDITTAADPLHQWILPATYVFDTTDANPANWNSRLLDNFGFTMRPYEGYWIFVKRANLQFIFPGVDTPGASVTRAALVGVGTGASQARATASNWRLQLRAKSETSVDTTTFIGVHPKASESNDYYKLNKPPMLDNQVSLSILRGEGTSSGTFAQDLRSDSASKKTWNMVLNSAKPNETVQVSWPEIAASVPRSYRLTMVDTATNQRYDLRSRSSVALTTGSDRTRSFQIVAEPTRGTSAAVITNFDVLQNRTRGNGSPSSVTINYALAQTADTRVFIRSTSGRSLRTLVGTTRAATDGTNTGSMVWDMRDDKGAALPAGTYSVELLARDDDGKTHRQTRVFLITR